MNNYFWGKGNPETPQPDRKQEFNVEKDYAAGNNDASSSKMDFKKRGQDVPTLNENDFKKKGYNRKDIIDAMNYLQHKLTASGQAKLDISLPQIVAVGVQGAGKSSVLESFVGREFLPRGRGTVTRRPTILQMIPCREEYAVFAHKPDEIFTDFNKVREEIEAETARHPGKSGFTSDPITIEIYSPRVLKLTVVDLPGLIKNVEDGDKESNIGEVRNMVVHYIRPEEALILAVTPATQDLLASEALEIAKEMDPRRKRTIGVITKLDLMGEGEDYKRELENRSIYLNMGYVGVINRNQKEIEQKKDIDYILKREQEFFENHPQYKHMKDQMGVPYLIKLLQKTLRGHIKKFLPQIRNDVSKRLMQLKKELRDFNKRVGKCNVFDGMNGKRDYVIQLILNFAEDISIQLFGNSVAVDSEHFSAGTLINFKLATEVHKNVSLTIHPNEEKAQIFILNVLGVRTAISVPGLALDALNSNLLEQFKEPMEASVRCIKEVLESAIAERAKVMDKYPSLKNEILHQIRESIDNEADNTREKLLEHVETNMSFINYNHPDFDISTCFSLSPSASPLRLWQNSCSQEDRPIQDNEISSSDLPNKETMMRFLKQNENNLQNVKYCTAVVMKNIEYAQKQMIDIVIKYIIKFLIKEVLNFIKTKLLSKVLNSPSFDSLSEDCEADFYWKKETEISCQLLQDVLEAIQDF